MRAPQDPPRPFRYALIGAGRVGVTVAEGLRRAGHEPVGVSSRSLASAERAAGRLGCPVFEVQEPPPADVYLLAVPDAAIAEVAQILVPALDASALLVHHAGSLGVAALAPGTERGHGACALHPVLAFVDIDQALDRLAGLRWGVTYSEGSRDLALKIVEDLDGRAIEVAEADRALWHAAAVMTSNGIGALLALGATMLRSIDVHDPVDVLQPLVDGTVRNVLGDGARPRSITGPFVRGESATVIRHLRAIEDRASELAGPYRAIAQMILLAASGAGSLDPDELEEMTALLGPST